MVNKTDNPFFEIAMRIFSIFFADPKPVSTNSIKSSLNIGEYDLKRAYSLLNDILRDFSPLFIQEAGNHLVLKTRPEFSEYIKLRFLQKGTVKLSDEAYITLAVIAYKQPIKKSAIDDLRGVDSEKTLDNLKRFGLVKTIGSTSEPGSPLLYVTTREFLLKFNLKDLTELPNIEG